MVLLNSVAFVVFKILRNLVSMQNFLNANNCGHKENFGNCPMRPHLYFNVLTEYVINFASNLVFLAVENVVSFT